MGACTNAMGRRSGGCDTATRKVFAGVNRLLPKTGVMRRSTSENVCRPETTIHCQRCVVGRISLLGNGRIFIWRTFPSPRSVRTPTVLIVDSKGIVKREFVGKLPDA